MKPGRVIPVGAFDLGEELEREAWGGLESEGEGRMGCPREPGTEEVFTSSRICWCRVSRVEPGCRPRVSLSSSVMVLVWGFPSLNLSCSRRTYEVGGRVSRC